MNVSEELEELRKLDASALAAEVFALRERLRYVQRSAVAALKRAEESESPMPLITEMANFAIPCDLLPENKQG